MNRKFVFVIIIFFVLPMSDCNIKASKPEGKVKAGEKNTAVKSESVKKQQSEKVQNSIKPYVFSLQKNKIVEKNTIGIREVKINNKINAIKAFSGKDFFLLITAACVILLIIIVIVQNHISSRR
jgi:hypothetical protein